MNNIDNAAQISPNGRNLRASLRSLIDAIKNFENPYAMAFIERTIPSSPFSKPNGANAGIAIEKFLRTM